MIIFIYGQDSYRSKQKISELEENFRLKVDNTGQNIIKFSDPVDISKAVEAIRTIPLFVRRQMVVVEDVFLAKSGSGLPALIGYLQKNHDSKDENSNIIVFSENSDLTKLNSEKKKLHELLLTASDYKFEFPKLSNTEAAHWAKREIESQGAAITQQVAARLVYAVGNDSWQLKNEADKLAHHALSRPEKTVTMADIDVLVRGADDENIFLLIDLVLRKDKKGLADQLEAQLTAGVSDVYILSSLTRQFINLLAVKELNEKKEGEKKIATDLGLHPYVVKKALQQTYFYKSEELRRIINSLIDLDYRFKSGMADIPAELARLFLN